MLHHELGGCLLKVLQILEVVDMRPTFIDVEVRVSNAGMQCCRHVGRGEYILLANGNQSRSLDFG